MRLTQPQLHASPSMGKTSRKPKNKFIVTYNLALVIIHRSVLPHYSSTTLSWRVNILKHGVTWKEYHQSQIPFSHVLSFCLLLQIDHYRTSQPLLLPADGGVDAHHWSILYRQTSASGQTFFCTWVFAYFLLCYERLRGESCCPSNLYLFNRYL